MGAGPDDSTRVTVLGFSQGVATAARWVTLGRVRPVRLILWGDHVPPDLDMDRASASLADVDLILARGRRDPIFKDGLAGPAMESLDAAGIAYRVVEYDGGHDIDQRLLGEIAGTGV